MANNKVSSLKKSSDFRYIGQKGQKIRLSGWLTLTIVSHKEGCVFYGVIASRKVGPAVVRNKLKRWIRYLLRQQPFNQNYYNKSVVFSFRPQQGDFYKKLSFKDFKTLVEDAKN